MACSRATVEAPDPDRPRGGGPEPLKLAIVGRPNVGKSSLVNAITQSARVIVSPIPGTTRDSVDVPFEVDTEGHRQSYLLIDTAGIRKPKRASMTASSSTASDALNLRSPAAISLCSCSTPKPGYSSRTRRSPTRSLPKTKPASWWSTNGICSNRSSRRPARISPDATPRARTSQSDPNLESFGRWVQESLFFLDYAPVIFTSATEGLNLDRLLESVRYVAAQLQQRIPTAMLNRTIQQAVERRQPISPAGHFLKFFYATQTQSAPPTFLLFVNRDELFSDRLPEVPRRRTPQSLWLRRLPHRAHPQSQTQNHRIRPHRQTRDNRPKARKRAPAYASPLISLPKYRSRPGTALVAPCCVCLDLTQNQLRIKDQGRSGTGSVPRLPQSQTDRASIAANASGDVLVQNLSSLCLPSSRQKHCGSSNNSHRATYSHGA